MKIYLVGGAIRDLLLKRPVKERDFLVVNGTIEEMVDQGFIQVGKDFPVFLHPVTKEEYALARVERKVGIGYYGFTCDSSNVVTLEDDLIRRDLTINAMVLPVTNTSHIDLENIKSENIIDPFGGKADIENRVLRHVSDAFAEDPVRVLRISRFMARYHHLGFTVAPETIQLLKTIVANGEINNLVAERVWKELERALSEKDPHLFFITLNDCDAFNVLFPSFNSQNYLIGIQSLIKANNDTETIKLAAFLHTLSTKDIEKLSQRFRFPNNYKDLCLLVAKYHDLAIKISIDISNGNRNKLAHELLELFVGLNVIHQIDRFEDFLNTVSAIFKRNNDEECFPTQKFLTMASAFKEESAKITQRLLVAGIHGKEMGTSLQKERLSCIELLLSQPR